MTQAIKASVFVGTSLDGFIARLNGDLDFLPAGGGEELTGDQIVACKNFCTALSSFAWLLPI